MSADEPLNLFYEEPDPDRWFPFDRYPRKLVRTLVRGAAQPRGMRRAFLNLIHGLDRIGAPYRVNDYRRLRSGDVRLACIFGKPHLVEKVSAEMPILFGTSIYSHPKVNSDLPRQRNIRQVLVPSAWVCRMFEQTWPGLISIWPTGIDTERWTPTADKAKNIDVLIYDKIIWQRERYVHSLIEPLARELSCRGLRVETVRYGSYLEEDFLSLSKRVRSMIYLSRHETQGVAAQQMLAAGVPLLAWDQGGFWQDPNFYPQEVQFEPVSSMPYWDDRCGMKFREADDIPAAFGVFWRAVENDEFTPRQFIVERFTLEKCATEYVLLARRFS